MLQKVHLLVLLLLLLTLVSHGIEGGWYHRLVGVMMHSHTRTTGCILLEKLVGLKPAQPVNRGVALSLLARVAIAEGHRHVVIEEDADFCEFDHVHEIG